MKYHGVGMVILVLFILLLSSISVNFFSNSAAYASSHLSKHGRIVINNDIQFEIMAQKEGWPGNGTAENPYIIENYTIDAHGSGPAIYIGNTTVYFVLRNNVIYNISSQLNPNIVLLILSLYGIHGIPNGIMLVNVKHGMLENNTVRDALIGISLISSSQNIIRENNLSHTMTGIYLNTMSSSNRVVGNICNAIYGGIEIGYSSNDNMIKDNVIERSIYGIYISGGNNNVFYNNSMGYGGIIFPTIAAPSADIIASQEIAPNNTVNGKIVYYYKNTDMHNSRVPEDAGEVIAMAVKNLNLENLTLNTSTGVSLYYSSNITVENCSFSGETKASLNSTGVLLEWSYGIISWHSSDVAVRNNTFENLVFGVYAMDGSTSNVVSGNIFRNLLMPISLENTYYNRIFDNHMVNGSIVLWGDSDTYTTQNITMDNTVNGKPVYYYRNRDMKNATVPGDAGEVILGNVKNIKIQNTVFSNESGAIFAGYSSNIVVENVTAYNTLTPLTFQSTNDSQVLNGQWYSNEMYGLYLVNSHRNRIVGNVFHEQESGIGILSTVTTIEGQCNVIKNNTFYNNTYGIYLWSNRNIVENNSFANDKYGIGIEYSNYNKLRGNVMKNDGIRIDGFFSTQDIDTSNLVNGKPVYYYRNQDMHGATVSENAGEIILGNVTNLQINNLTIGDSSIGIIVGQSRNIKITNTTLTHNTIGLLIDDSHNVTVESNTLMYNDEGITLELSDKCIIHNNIISYSRGYGLNVSGFENLIYENYFYYNHGSGDKYSREHVQACDNGFRNKWNTTSRGNYWQDWQGPDENGDGIVDEPYAIDGFAKTKDYRPICQSNIPEFSEFLPLIILILIPVVLKRKRR